MCVCVRAYSILYAHWLTATLTYSYMHTHIHIHWKWKTLFFRCCFGIVPYTMIEIHHHVFYYSASRINNKKVEWWRLLPRKFEMFTFCECRFRSSRAVLLLLCFHCCWFFGPFVDKLRIYPTFEWLWHYCFTFTSRRGKWQHPHNRARTRIWSLLMLNIYITFI